PLRPGRSRHDTRSRTGDRARSLARRAHRGGAPRIGAENAVTRAELARLIDHSVLKPDAIEADILAGAATVRTWSIGYYCVQPYWVRTAAHLLAGTDARIVTVTGFPHGS